MQGLQVSLTLVLKGRACSGRFVGCFCACKESCARKTHGARQEGIPCCVKPSTPATPAWQMEPQALHQAHVSYLHALIDSDNDELLKGDLFLSLLHPVSSASHHPNLRGVSLTTAISTAQPPRELAVLPMLVGEIPQHILISTLYRLCLFHITPAFTIR